MSKLQNGVRELHEIDIESAKRRNATTVSPLARIIVTIVFVCVTLSFPRLNLYGVASMCVFIVVYFILDDISIVNGLKRFAPAVAVLLMTGITNGIVDYIYGREGSVIAMATLLLKGALTVCACYFLFVQIGMEGICGALHTIHVPKILITILMLNYRYIIVMLKEIERMYDAYKLRAPTQKGIHISAWGSFAGLLLLRCIERAKEVYNSMLLRGYDGTMTYYNQGQKYSTLTSTFYVVIWMAVFTIFRVLPIFNIIGNLITK